MYIILAIVIFGFLIFVHELGHFLAAKLLGVRVNEFSMCMGPAIWQKTVGETTYSLRCIPIGGFCAMEGEAGDSEDPRAFTKKAPWRRLIILAAGSFNNFLAGLLILLVLYSTASGFNVPVIAGFFEGSTLPEETGLEVGDEILSINGQRVYLYSDISLLLDRGDGAYYDLVVRRNGQRVELPQARMVLHDFEIDGETVQRYGLYFGTEDNSLGLTLKYTLGSALDFSRMIWMSLGDLFSGGASVQDVSGVVGIVSVMNETGQAAASVTDGILDVLYFGAFLAINLAIMNMLPIPALDGGRVFLLLVTVALEKLLGRKIDPKYEAYIHAAGMFLLLGLIAVITLKDIITLF